MEPDKFDKYNLYQVSVQCPEADISFIINTFEKIRKRTPYLIKEDFCGTALFCAEWVTVHKNNKAIGIDLDQEPLNWGKKYNLAPLTDDRKSRVDLRQENVLKVLPQKSDVVVAFNFSYFCFKTRMQMKQYVRAAYQNLKEDGILMLDILGGPETQEIREEKKNFGYFTYIWDQSTFNPINHHFMCYIHFKFNGKNKSKRPYRKSFIYDWRMWTIPELEDLLREEGFKDVQVYWEGEDRKSGEGNGVFTLEKTVENSPAWVAYIVAIK